MASWLSRFRIVSVCILALSVSWSTVQVFQSSSFYRDQGAGEIVLSAGSWDSPEDVVGDVKRSLLAEPLSLFSLFTSTLQDTFGREEFDRALVQQGVVVIAAEVISDLDYLNEEWAEFVIRVSLDDGIVQDFLVILFQEGGKWKIFGTKQMES
ncbi:hypothetical protein KJ596_02105 [Patescibacteria group bacterium]|nr:hypothetical protein [Patescibacteria group bacterium]MBU1868735.1 hypothetical protein [Patescibacteria group bacterium]